jgi:hypothetical protein
MCAKADPARPAATRETGNKPRIVEEWIVYVRPPSSSDNDGVVEGRGLRIAYSSAPRLIRHFQNGVSLTEKALHSRGRLFRSIRGSVKTPTSNTKKNLQKIQKRKASGENSKPKISHISQHDARTNSLHPLLLSPTNPRRSILPFVQSTSA